MSSPSPTTAPDAPPKSTSPEISVVLVRPREEGNIGSVARAMANMGLEDLILVEPAAEIGGVARGFGVGGWSVLEAARRLSSLDEALAPFELAVGTSSGRERPLRGRDVLASHELARALSGGNAPNARSVSSERRVALVFGPEATGLRRDELEACDLLVTIPCAAEHPTLNLAQAVLIIAYELHLAQLLARAPAVDTASHTKPVETTVGERHELIELTRPLVTDLGFDQEHLREGIVRDLRSLLRRARPDRRQLGVLRRLVARALQLTAPAGDDRE